MTETDFIAQAVETWQINARLNPYLIQALNLESWAKKVEKCKFPQGHFAHVHNVRLMWLKSAAPELLEGLDKLEDASIELTLVALAASAEAMAKMIQTGFETGRIKGFKPHPSAFLGYIIAHESFHRAQVELCLRQLGTPIDDKTAYGLWEWGTR